MRAGVTASTRGDGRRGRGDVVRLIELVTQSIPACFELDPVRELMLALARTGDGARLAPGRNTV